MNIDNSNGKFGTYMNYLSMWTDKRITWVAS